MIDVRFFEATIAVGASLIPCETPSDFQVRGDSAAARYLSLGILYPAPCVSAALALPPARLCKKRGEAN